MRYIDNKEYVKKCNVKYICYRHIHIVNEKLIPFFNMRRRCIECLKNTVYAYVGRYQIIVENYNYLFPVFCDSCSSRLHVCKWCRPLLHNFIFYTDCNEKKVYVNKRYH